MVWADEGYSSPLAAGASPPNCRLRIVAQPASSKAFAALPRRWVFERTFARFSCYHCLSIRGLKMTPLSSRAWVFVAMILLVRRRLQPT